MHQPDTVAQGQRNGAVSCFGSSGLDITILDYGLSRAESPASDEAALPVAYDFEKDLGIFTSTHAPQCKVYRRMRSFLLRGDPGPPAPQPPRHAVRAGAGRAHLVERPPPVHQRAVAGLPVRVPDEQLPRRRQGAGPVQAGDAGALVAPGPGGAGQGALLLQRHRRGSGSPSRPRGCRSGNSWAIKTARSGRKRRTRAATRASSRSTLWRGTNRSCAGRLVDRGSAVLCQHNDPEGFPDAGPHRAHMLGDG